ncbi:phytase [Neptunicella marina]|uniref:Phytase n=1 Tax=Neptunicella marina TaxID=2125989 RepID=A0A8J6M1W2_9ALTE|nr:phytase [Neptunicella marina]MBC3765878.1 phytase [Neptunicella marina]
MKHITSILALLVLSVSGCANTTQTNQAPQTIQLNTLPMLMGTWRQAPPIEHNHQLYWLTASEQSGLQVWDQTGTLLGQFAGNTENSDIRVLANQHYVISTVERESGDTLLLELALPQGELTLVKRIRNPLAEVEALCLYQDQQHNIQLFSVDTLGDVQQRVVFNQQQQQFTDVAVRHFIGAPNIQSCVADDNQQTLYLVEENIGVWQYSANPERDASRTLISAVSPFGNIKGEVKHANLLANGNLLISAPEHNQLWLINPTNPDAAKAYSFVLPDGSTPKIENAVTTALNGKLLAGVYDDETGNSYQANIPLNPIKNNSSKTKNAVFLADKQTTPVSRFGDAADDPAIWINKHNTQQSLILGTNKKQGLMVYNLAGELKQSLDIGRVNNVDVRYGVSVNGQLMDIATASNRSNQHISIFSINPQTAQVALLSEIATDLSDIYGLCMYQSQQQTYVFVNDTNGRYQQYQLDLNKKITAKKVREFSLPSQPEGCVADDQHQLLYMGEEAMGIWQINAEPVQTDPQLIIKTNDTFVADVEGLGIYLLDGQRYLIASSQGNDSYAVFALDKNNQHIGSFTIEANIAAGIDGTSETDGLDITSIAIGSHYPDGLLVVQDGRNVMPTQPQNFKLINATQLKQQILHWLK